MGGKEPESQVKVQIQLSRSLSGAVKSGNRVTAGSIGRKSPSAVSQSATARRSTHTQAMRRKCFLKLTTSCHVENGPTTKGSFAKVDVIRADKRTSMSDSCGKM